MRYIQTPDSARKPFGDLIEQFWPGVHHAYDWNWVTLGPAAVYARYKIGAIATERLTLTHSRYAPGGWTALHTHPDHEHAYHLVKGQGLFQIGGELRVLGPGAGAYVPTGVRHGHRPYGAEPLELLDIHALTSVPPYAPSGSETRPEPIPAPPDGYRPQRSAGRHTRTAHELSTDPPAARRTAVRAALTGRRGRQMVMGPRAMIAGTDGRALRSESLEITVTELNPGGRLELAAGSATESAVFILDGEADAAVEDESATASAGSTVYAPATASCSVRNPGDGVLRILEIHHHGSVSADQSL